MSKEDIERLDIAKALLDDYAQRTGLVGNEGKIEQRYLWTDTFAVQSFFGLYHIFGVEKYRTIAVKLIDAVHEILGKYNPLDTRKGWISGLSEEEGRKHPTAGGLRIGKRLPERMPDEKFDENLEWDRDGQYFHYITRWVNALLIAEKETGEHRYALWAAELMQATDKFIDKSRGRVLMHWKMSIDLSRPLVASMGMHDPLEGLICAESILEVMPEKASEMDPYIKDLEEICSERNWFTSDPLGIGGLLLNAIRAMELTGSKRLIKEIEPEKLISDCIDGLEMYANMHDPNRSVNLRLAFRECGLSLGLRAIYEFKERTDLKDDFEKINRYMYLANDIESFWADTEKHTAYIWKEYLDINSVSLASSIIAQYQPYVFYAFKATR